ncbi:hypothetical protein F4824DRAFT_507200 [Ustulina deusta]|nr:hypothetical protein F4824DRAFT_507200 [Ustulina deusta]
MRILQDLTKERTIADFEKSQELNVSPRTPIGWYLEVIVLDSTSCIAFNTPPGFLFGYNTYISLFYPIATCPHSSDIANRDSIDTRQAKFPALAIIMSHHNSKISGGYASRLGPRLMMLAAIITGGLAVVPVPAAAENGVVLADSQVIEAREQVNPCNVGHNLNKKQGPYAYGNNSPEPSVTFTAATVTVTLTATDVATETVIPSFPTTSLTTQTTDVSVSGYTSMSTTTITTTIPYGTFHADTASSSYDSTLTSSTVDGQTNSVTSLRVSSSSNIQSGPDVTTSTIISPTSNYTDTSTPVEQSPSIQVTTSTITPYITVTTTIFCSVSDCEEYTGTETVTVTPYVTTTEGTTITLSSATETPATGSTLTETNQSPVTVTVTVYVSQLSTQAQTGAVGSSVSTTVSEVVTATVVQTVSPVPTGPLTTKCTESTMTSTRSIVTIRSTFTITVGSGSLIYTIDGTTNGTSTATTTVTSGAATASIDTTCTTSSAVIDSTSVFATMTSPSPTAIHAPYPVSNTLLGSVVFLNTTGAVTVEAVTASGNVTVESLTKDTASTHTPNFHYTHSITAYPASTTVSVSSGADLGKKRPVKVFWGESDGGFSHTCVILLVMIIALIL